MLNTHHYLMKKVLIVILALLLTIVWSSAAVRMSDKASRLALLPVADTICSPAAYPMGEYDLTLEVGEMTTFPLEYYNLLLCSSTESTLTITLPSPPKNIYDTICAGESYEWNSKTYFKPGIYTDTLQNIYGCDSIVTLHLEVLPDPPITFTVNGVSFKMMRVRAGTFMMGATPEQGTDALPDEKPAHQVTLTRDYFIGETMLTQELWTAVMGTTIQEEETKGTGEKNLGYGPNYPMYCLSYNDCLNFVKTLSDSVGLEFRMPTEAEWEYAARGGHLSRGYKYPGSNDPFEVAWSIGNDPQKKLHPVKQLKPNELGVYDMAGNVWEYIYDFRRTYTAEPQVNPMGDINGNKANIRGGSTAWNTGYNRVSFRSASITLLKSDKSARRAFRFVLDADRVIGEDNTTYLAYDTICAGETITWNGNTYSKPGSYTDTLSNIHGCDSIVTLHLHVNPTYEVHDTIVACDSYTFNPFNKNGGGITICESGTYKDTTTSISGCDSVFVLHLTINHSILQEYHNTAFISYTWKEGKTYSQSGVYYDSLSTINGCDSIEILYLNILPPTEYFVYDTLLCYGSTCEWRNKQITTEGTYNDTVKNQLDCDSLIYILNLKYLPDVVFVEEDTLLCYGVTCEWRNKQLTTEGTYNDTIKNQLDCDSFIYILNLKYLPDVVFVEEDTLLCYGVTCEWRELQLTTEGTYNDTVKNQLNCDSVIYILNLNYLPDVEHIKEDTLLCYGVTCEWRDMLLTNEGTYKDTVKNQLDCDSVIYILNLKYLPDVVYIEEDTLLCHGATCEWRNKQLTNEGTYKDTVKNQLDCDSVIYILHLEYLPDVVFVEEDTLLCHGITCNWRSLQLNTEGTYKDTVKNQLDGDSIIYILHLNYLPDVEYIEEDTLLCYGATCEWRSLQLTTEGTYKDTVKNQLNCDSVIYILNIEYLPDVVFIEEDTLLCHGITCNWRSLQLNTEGTYKDTVKNQLDCDSVIYILHLNYLPDVEYIEEDTLLCYGATCEWRDMLLTTEGTYKDTVKNQLDCDSVIYILNLKYLPDVVFIEEDTLLCYGVTCEWRELQLTTEGTYNDTVKNQLDCDSVIYILNLEYLPDVQYIEEDTLLYHGATCEWRGLQLTTEGTYKDTVKNQLDCDSVIYILHLEYLPQVQHFITDTFLCYGEVCDWREVVYAESGVYRDTVRNILDCDSLIFTLNLTIYPEIPITHVIDTIAGTEYHWHDNTYTEGGEYMVTLSAITGCDSVVVLHLLDNHAAIDTVIMYEQCAGSGEQEIEILTQGFIDSIALRYSPLALQAGLTDTLMPLSENDLYTIQYRDVRAGAHEVTAVGLFRNEEVAQYTFALTYLYPNTIFEQRYNDLLAVLTHDYNGGYDFTAFQWYQDNMPLQGETNSYLNQQLNFNAEYSVLLTDTNGVQLMSCPFIPTNRAEISIYPTIVKPGEKVNCYTTEGNKVYIHDSTGQLLNKLAVKAGTTEIYMPTTSGIYMLRFESSDHTERTYKIIVQ